MVSVAVMAYNQENEVKKALDSIHNQNCDFPVEIVVGVDLSLDNTQNVVQSYSKKSPENIQYITLFHNEHVGEQINIVSILKKCSGKYIAFLDADDFWNDNLKIQKQVEIMENNPEIGVVYTDDYFLSTAFEKPIERRREPPWDNVFTQMLLGCPITTETAMFRRDLLKYVEYDIMLQKKFIIEDDFLWLELANHTKFHHLNEFTATATLTRSTIFSYNVPLMSAEYDKHVTEIKLHYLDKYPDKTHLTKTDILDLHHSYWVKAAILCNNKNITIGNLSKIVNKSKYQKLLLVISNIPLGFKTYMLYRRLKGKDKKNLYERYFF